MSPIEDLVSRLANLGVRLWVDEEGLHVKAREGRLTPADWDELDRRKDEIIQFLRRARLATRSDQPAIRPVSRGRALPLSFAQQRLWFLGQLDPESAAYNMSHAYRLVGRLDQAALQLSIDEIVRRHQALRTVFAAVDGEPVQIVAPSQIVPVQVVDLQGLIPPSERETEATRRATEEGYRPFDLSRGPLVRVTLLRLDEEEHILILVLHHIVSDGWSNGVMWRELKALYEAYTQGRSSPLPELPIQYADYAAWQREWLQGDRLQAQLAYWREQLAGVPVTELPTDRPRPAVQTFAGARHALNLPVSLREELKGLSRQEGTTLYMTLLAAFQVLLSHYTGQKDIVVGSPIANRTRAETEGLIGFFVNTLALRIDLSGGPTFRQLLGRVRELCLGAYAHQDVPFEKLVEELNPCRDLSRTPLFQVLFALQNAPRRRAELAGLTVTYWRPDKTTVRFDLECHLWESAEGIGGVLVYNTDLYQAASVARLASHYRTLLERIVAHPDRPIGRLSLLAEEERRQLVEGWNQTRQSYRRDQTAVGLFEAQVERSPEAAAVIFEGERLNFRALNARANRVAHYLQSRGAGEEAVVGLCMERSLELTVGLLGVLKSGAAYLPLDPSYPAERLAFMLRDAGAGWVVTQEGKEGLLGEHGAEVVCLDSDWPTMAVQSAENPEEGAGSTNLAYVLYTSGSTGIPKGVEMEHGALHNLLCWQLEQPTLAAGNRTLQFTPLSFDVSFQEIMATWCSGGTLVMVGEETRRDPEALIRTLTEAGIERLFLPFVALQMLAQAAEGQEVTDGLREVITAGEQLRITPEIVRLFARVGPGCRLHNQYGPTESHVVTAYTLEGEPESWALLPPIGRPIANTEIYLLDREMEPVPVGVVGELYVGGEALARGYRSRPGLAAERFVPDPFGGRRGARLYRTGDLARYRADGNIEFLGRADSQVKIRGFRVELGEVEAVLGQHPAVKDAVVVAREGATSAETGLVGYIVAAGEEEPLAGELRAFLKQKLPEYMVPAAYMTLDALPLTPSGKVDRRGLPVPEQASVVAEARYVAPRTDIEERIASIWAEVLRLKSPVGIHDHFFELGGHSLFATQVVARIRSALQVELPVRALFERPTVVGLAESIETIRQMVPGAGIPVDSTGHCEVGEL